MSHPKTEDCIRVLRLLVFSSRQVFEEIRPPTTPLFVPLLCVTLVASIFWVMVYSFMSGAASQTSLFGELIVFSRPSLGWFVCLWLVGLYLMSIGVILLGTYLYALARCFRVDDIRWEHWFGFASWTLVPMSLVLGLRTYVAESLFLQIPPLLLSVLVVSCYFLLIVWTIFLTVQGLRIWTERPKGWYLFFSVLPCVLVVLWVIPDAVDLIRLCVYQTIPEG